MREQDRKEFRARLDREMRPYRTGGNQKDATPELLRAVRLALGIPVKEVAEKSGVGRSQVYEIEGSERRQTITLQVLGRAAAALGCKVVYGIVPEGGKTLEWMAEERAWRKVIAEEGAWREDCGEEQAEKETHAESESREGEERKKESEMTKQGEEESDGRGDCESD